MPLALIVCDSPEEAAPLAARFRDLGYQVHFSSHDSASDTACDLRIELNTFTPDAALNEAQSFAAANPAGYVLVGRRSCSCHRECRTVL